MAGPPVEVQVRVNTGGSVVWSVFNWKVISPGIVTWPVGGKGQLVKMSHKYVVNLICLNLSYTTTGNLVYFFFRGGGGGGGGGRIVHPICKISRQ